jgi:hypothetical protein
MKSKFYCWKNFDEIRGGTRVCVDPCRMRERTVVACQIGVPHAHAVSCCPRQHPDALVPIDLVL